MGIGSFFASLFQKEEDDRREIRKLDLAPERIERTSTDADGSSISRKKETVLKNQSSVSEKVASDANPDSRVKDRVEVMDGGTVPGSAEEKMVGETGAIAEGPGKGGRKDRPRKKKAATSGKQGSQGQAEDSKADSDRYNEQGQARDRKADSDRHNDRDRLRGAVEEAVSQEADGFKKAKRDFYQYLNNTMRILYQADQDNSWESTPALASPSDNVRESLDRIKDELPEKLVDLVLPFADENKLADPASLKPAFYAMLLPFYPLYASCFEDFKFNTFLNREALDLFRRLTGRKFRLGYRNRYPEGHNAFEWKGETYRVYDRKGQLLCDAVFSDGLVKDGYAVLPEEGSQDPDWSVRRKGVFVDGEFSDGAVEYIFKKTIE